MYTRTQSSKAGEQTGSGFIGALVLLLVLTLPASGCVRAKSCAFAAQSPSAGAAIPDGFGVNIDFTDPRPGEVKMVAEAGFRWVRMDLKWDVTEKERGRYDFSAYDRLHAALEPHGIRTLFILDYGNPLYENGAPPRTEATRQAFARWAVAAAKHFANQGVVWEIYNEPNHSLFWPPQPKVEEYVALALVVGRAFRESVPGEKLIGPATSEIDFAFLESCFQAGLLEYWAAVSIHPYRRSDPETAAQDYCRLREMIKRYAGTGKTRDIPIIASEWGYSSAWRELTEEKQAELLARSWLTNVANNISLSIWYDWHDDGLDPREAEHHFGTVFNRYYDNRDPVYDPKPAYLAVKTLTTFFSGYRFEQRFDAGSEADYVLAFRRGQDLRLAAWTTGRDHRVLVGLKAGRYTVSKHTGDPVGIITSEQKGLAIDLGTAPVYLRQSDDRNQ